MKIGYLTTPLGDVPLPDQFRWAAAQGFRAVELNVLPAGADLEALGQEPFVGGRLNVRPLNEDGATRVRETAEENGLEISCLMYGGNPLHGDPDARAGMLEHLDKMIEAAAWLNVENVSCFVGRDVTKTVRENIDEFKAVFEAPVKKAADRGVRIAIENCPMIGRQQEMLPDNIACSPAVWRALFEIYPDLGLNFDPSHLVWTGVDPVQAVYEFASHIFHVHAKDTEVLESVLAAEGILMPGVDWWRYRIPGLGQTDWARLISALYEIGYHGAVSIEHEDPVWSGSEEKVKAGLLIGKRHLEQFLAQGTGS